MIYKRNNHKLSDVKGIEYIATNNSGVYVNSTVVGEALAPYHGVFILQIDKTSKVIVPKITEVIDFGSTVYSVKDYRTNEIKHGGCEYLESFEKEYYPKYTYYFGLNNEQKELELTKSFMFLENQKAIAVCYTATNYTNRAAKISVEPYVTYRDAMNVKRKSEIKFTSSCVTDSCKTTLSITDDVSLYLKSLNMIFEDAARYECGINYDITSSNYNLKTVVEDLYVPGTFTVVAKANDVTRFAIILSTKEIQNKQIDLQKIEEYNITFSKNIVKDINPNYYELRALARTASTLQYIDRDNMKMVLLDTYPMKEQLEDDSYIKDIITSIDGNYIILKKYKEAKRILEIIGKGLVQDMYNMSSQDKCEADMLYVEAVNRYIQESEERLEDVASLYKFIKQIVTRVLQNNALEYYMDKDFLLMTDNKKYIKINALWYNALQIYIDLADKFIENHEYAHTVAENVKNNIIEKFWNADECILRYEINEMSYPTIDMIYTLSLSFPLLHDKIAMKLVDTAFKTLYTPLGMRLRKDWHQSV